MAKRKQYLYGTIDQNGVFKFSDSVAFAKVRAQLRGQEVQILIEPKSKKRTLLENNYYWGVVVEMLSDYTGYTPNEMHENLKRILLSTKDSRGLLKTKSTADLSTVEFEEYLTAVRKWASKQGLFIPMPNEEIY